MDSTVVVVGPEESHQRIDGLLDFQQRIEITGMPALEATVRSNGIGGESSLEITLKEFSSYILFNLSEDTLGDQKLTLTAHGEKEIFQLMQILSAITDNLQKTVEVAAAANGEAE